MALSTGNFNVHIMAVNGHLNMETGTSQTLATPSNVLSIAAC